MGSYMSPDPRDSGALTTRTDANQNNKGDWSLNVKDVDAELFHSWVDAKKQKGDGMGRYASLRH